MPKLLSSNWLILLKSQDKAVIDACHSQEQAIENYAAERNHIAETDNDANDKVQTMAFLQNWADLKVTKNTLENRYLAILGEYGMGKTWCCIRFAMEQIKRYKEDPKNPLAIYLDLRRYAEGDSKLSSSSAPELKEIIAITLVRQLGDINQDLTAEDVLELVRNQGAIIIFDGLDEVANYLSSEKKKAFYRQLVSILPKGLEQNPEQFKNPGKLILSCRSNQFATFKEETNLFNDNQRDDGKWLFRILHLLPFATEQIRQYFEHNLPERDADELLQLLSGIHNLTELARRPYNLNLISRQIHKIEQHKASDKVFYGVTLYQNLVEEWLERDDPKHQFDKTYKPTIMQHLAAFLHKSQLREIPHDKLRQWLDNWLRQQPEIQEAHQSINRDTLASDLRTATFICRPQGDTFRFAHTSLQEFFLARYLFDGLLPDPMAALSDNPEKLNQARLNRWKIDIPSPETLEFLRQLIASEPENQADINHSICELLGQYQAQRSELAFRFWLQCQQSELNLARPEKIDMRGANLYQFTCLNDKNAPALNLRGCDFSGANLVSSDWQGIDFSFCLFNKADGRGSRWRYCKMVDSQFEQADFSVNSQMLACQLPESAAEVSRLVRSQPTQPPLKLPASHLDPVFANGHVTPIHSATFSHDDRRIITASIDGTAKIWDAQSALCIATLNGHKGTVTSAAFSHDDRRIITASHDGTAKIWDAQSALCIATLNGHKGTVKSAAFSHDDRHIITSSDDGTAKIWDAQSALRIATLSGHEASVTSAAFSHDDRRIITSSHDGTAKIWDAQSALWIATLNDHKDTVYSAAFSHDDRRIITSSHDGVKIWDAQSALCILTLNGHKTWINSAAFSHDDRRIITASSDHTAKIWDAQSALCITTLNGHKNIVFSAAFSHDDQRIISSSFDSTSKIWDAQSALCIATLNGHKNIVFSATFSHDDRRIITASSDNTAKIWDAQSASYVATLNGHKGIVLSAAFSHDDRRIITASSDHTAKIWDAQSALCIATLNDHTDRVISAAFSHDNLRIITASFDNTTKIWDAQSALCIATLNDHTDRVTSAAFSHDDRRIITSCFDGTAKIWDAQSALCIATLIGHKGRVTSAAFSHDDRRIITSSYDGTAKIWDAQSALCIATLDGHTYRVNSAAFSHDDRHIITSSYDGTAKIWDAQSALCIATLNGHEGSVESAAFSHDDRRIITSSADNTAKIWDADPTSPNYGKPIKTLLFLPEGQWTWCDDERYYETSEEAWQWLFWQEKESLQLYEFDEGMAVVENK
ncbi:MAG: NACHT domain-containing protein [Reinekea sp.]